MPLAAAICHITNPAPARLDDRGLRVPLEFVAKHHERKVAAGRLVIGAGVTATAAAPAVAALAVGGDAAAVVWAHGGLRHTLTAAATATVTCRPTGRVRVAAATEARCTGRSVGLLRSSPRSVEMARNDDTGELAFLLALLMEGHDS